MTTCSYKLVLSQIYFFQFSKMVHFLVLLRFLLVYYHQRPQPQPPRGPPLLPPWLGPSGPALAGLPIAAGRLAPRAADLACVCCRVDCSAAGRTAIAAAALAWAAAQARAAQVWPPGLGLPSPVSPTPAAHVCLLARWSRRR